MNHAQQLKNEMADTSKPYQSTILADVKYCIRAFGKATYYKHGLNHVFNSETGSRTKEVQLRTQLPYLMDYLTENGFVVRDGANSHGVALYEVCLR